MKEFEDLGYYKEYWVNSKYIGYTKCKKDRDVIGYYGAKNETTTEAVTLCNKKKIKANTVVKTLLYPLSGKYIKQ